MNNFLIQNYILFIFTFFFYSFPFPFVHRRRSSMWNIESRPYNEIRMVIMRIVTLHNIYSSTVSLLLLHILFTNFHTKKNKADVLVVWLFGLLTVLQEVNKTSRYFVVIKTHIHFWLHSSSPTCCCFNANRYAKKLGRNERQVSKLCSVVVVVLCCRWVFWF